MLIEQAALIALAVVALRVGRAVAVYGCFAVLRALRADAVPMRWQHVMVFGNIKGALSMAAVLALPASLEYRERLIAVVFGVAFVTQVTARFYLGAGVDRILSETEIFIGALAAARAARR